ncbi:MAG: GrdX family protein [Bacillota bacterium]
MKKYIIVTNNPLVKKEINNELAEKNIQIKLNFCNDLDQVMVKTRDMIHKGYVLISHPLAGSVKPAQNPYRSILVQEDENLNYDSLKTIENAIQKLKQFQKNKENIDYPSEILEDYQVIDYSLINSGIKSLK